MGKPNIKISPKEWENMRPFDNTHLSKIVDYAEYCGVKTTFTDDLLEFESETFHVLLPDYRRDATLLEVFPDEYQIVFKRMMIIISPYHFNVGSEYLDINKMPDD